MRKSLMEACKTQYLLTDGGVSTMLRRMAGEAGAVVEKFNLDNPDLVLEMHEKFVDAGSDCLTTNSFSANAARLSESDSAECTLMCEEAARIARQVAGPDRYLLGRLGPWYQVGNEWEKAFAQQARALSDAGVDALYIETVNSIGAATVLSAIAMEHNGGLPVLVSFAFEKKGDVFTLVGSDESLDHVARALETIGADGYGVNCGRGLEAYDFSELISRMREVTGAPLLARPPAGDPIGDAAGIPEYPDSPEYMAEAVWGVVRAGANILGGCCGTTPEHIQAFRNELDMLG